MNLDNIQIILPKGRGQYYDELLDKYSGIGNGYQLDTLEKEDKFLEDIKTIIDEEIEFSHKLILLDFIIYQVQIEID